MTSEYVFKYTEEIPNLIVLDGQCFYALPSLKSAV